MTIIVGVLCQDGVVIGADGSATFAQGQLPIIEQPTQKIDIIDDSMIVVGTGEVGLGQRFKAIIEECIKLPNYQKMTAVNMMTELSHQAIKNFAYTFTQPEKIPYGALLAFSAGGKPQLCEFQYENMRPELKSSLLWFVSMGSGQFIVDPFLGLLRKVYWDSGSPTLQQGKFAVTWALRHAVDCNAGGINEPIQIATLTLGKAGKSHARLIDDDELEEHRQYVNEAEEHLRKLPGNLREADDTPEPPKPE